MSVLSYETQEAIANAFADNINKINEGILKKIGSAIKQIGNLTPSQAYQLAQILKYGGSYEEIVKELSKISGKSIDEVNSIFKKIAIEDKNFAKQFYDYRNIKFVPLEQDSVMLKQIDAIAKQTNEIFKNISNTKGIGYVFRDLDNNYVFKEIQEAYNDIIDRAIIAISQGKSTYGQEMKNIINDIGNSGLVQYESGYKRRLDSAVRMNIMDGIRQLQNATTEKFGEEYGADGIEISVHENPAPDHAMIQGRQFRIAEFNKVNEGQRAVDVNGNVYEAMERRHISEYNCYHKEFRIVVGVSRPEYTDEQLKKIMEDNEKGFELDGKHYTNYEGTQLQRRLETAIRKQKDRNILAKASGNKDIEIDSETKIRQLTNKYNELSKLSGLKPKKERMTVSGYKRNAIPKVINEDTYNFNDLRNMIDNSSQAQIRENFNYDKFIENYKKFHNTINKEELEKTNNALKNYDEFIFKVTGHPVGNLLNKELNYDKLPELIDKKDFWIDFEGEPIKDEDTSFIADNRYFRGIGGPEAKQYVEEFKNGKYYAGQGITGNGTYFTENYYYAKNYTNYDLNGELDMIYAIPKEDAKIIQWDKIIEVKTGLQKYYSNKPYEDNLTKFIMNDEGYIAQLLGYDMIKKEDILLVLNRGKIKVVK